DQAVNLTIQGAFKSAGQKCTATSRVIVQRNNYREFVHQLVEKTKTLTLGPGDDSAAYLGPVITEQARDRVFSAVERAASEGSKACCGPRPKDDARLNRGFYVAPTVIEGLRPEMEIAREEVFGPVLGVMEAADFEHAIELLNGVEYGLSASIFTRDLN